MYNNTIHFLLLLLLPLPQVQPVYIREAYRLLQKSIILVENEDIELEDIEEVGAMYSV